MIREARLDDVPAIIAMLHASAREQGYPDEVIVDEADVVADAFGPEARAHILVAEVDGVAAALALYFFTYSTWTSRIGLYLEDLYVRPEFRKRRLARGLMVALAKVALARGCGFFRWVTHISNDAAMGFYEGLGAEVQHDWRLLGLRGDAIRRLASGAEPT